MITGTNVWLVHIYIKPYLDLHIFTPWPGPTFFFFCSTVLLVLPSSCAVMQLLVFIIHDYANSSSHVLFAPFNSHRDTPMSKSEFEKENVCNTLKCFSPCNTLSPWTCLLRLFSRFNSALFGCISFPVILQFLVHGLFRYVNCNTENQKVRF